MGKKSFTIKGYIQADGYVTPKGSEKGLLIKYAIHKIFRIVGDEVTRKTLKEVDDIDDEVMNGDRFKFCAVKEEKKGIFKIHGEPLKADKFIKKKDFSSGDHIVLVSDYAAKHYKRINVQKKDKGFQIDEEDGDREFFLMSVYEVVDGVTLDSLKDIDNKELSLIYSCKKDKLQEGEIFDINEDCVEIVNGSKDSHYFCNMREIKRKGQQGGPLRNVDEKTFFGKFKTE